MDGSYLNTAQQRQLLQEVIEQEFFDTKQQLLWCKSPGINGFSTEFIEKNLSMVGKEVTTIIHQFFENGKLLKCINGDTTTLVPKISSPSFVEEYRLIA